MVLFYLLCWITLSLTTINFEFILECLNVELAIHQPHLPIKTFGSFVAAGKMQRQLGNAPAKVQTGSEHVCPLGQVHAVLPALAGQREESAWAAVGAMSAETHRQCNHRSKSDLFDNIAAIHAFKCARGSYFIFNQIFLL